MEPSSVDLNMPLFVPEKISLSFETKDLTLLFTEVLLIGDHITPLSVERKVPPPSVPAIKFEPLAATEYKY